MKKTFSEDNKGIFMNSTLVSRVAKNKTEEIRISVLKNNKIDLRIYFNFPNEPEPKPTKKGLWLSFKYMPKVITALEKLIKNPKEALDVELDTTEKEQIKIYNLEYNGKMFTHIRSFYQKDGAFAPGKGVSFSENAFPALLEGLKKACELNGKV